ncbi:hypothetical protein [Balneatrix alpica]|uniref:ABM domain-containing protein n=1 Tax=Balneatrix alpica TaxID=75684 RepID=A0ABV5ZCQ0_9GAMM|nr:hypothetical protein [Balneatrix alpica]
MDHTHLMSFAGMEFSRFRLRPGASEAQLRQAAATMVAGLYANEPGFLGHCLLRDQYSGEYVDVVFADSAERAQALCSKWGNPPSAPACLDYLALIEPGSAQLAFFQRL